MVEEKFAPVYVVYVLWSNVNEKFYIGYTVDLERRLKEHASGLCHTTQRFINAKLIFYEAYISKIDAQRREEYFKTTKGKKTLRLMLQDSLKRNDKIICREPDSC